MADINGAAPRNGGLLGLTWNGQVTAGNVLTALPIIAGLLIWGVRLESRVDHESELRSRLEQLVAREQARDAASFVELKAEILRQGEQTRASIERVADRIDRTIKP